ncbi:MAG: PAS domain S-box protein [Planctomycetaceae bacterium]|nr:PAS domain S-box protein [Planctomycetaceae bacterium]
MVGSENEEDLLRSVALRNANSILQSRLRAEEELVHAKEALERKTEELARSLAAMRATLEAATDGILVTDGERRLAAYNSRYVEMWRLPPSIIESRSHDAIRDFCGDQLAEPRRFRDRVEEIYATSPPETFDVLELSDGRVFERFTRLQILDGQDAGRVWSFRDVTERKRAEEVRHRLAAIVESSADAILSKTLDGVITTWNTGAEGMFGYQTEEIVGKSVTILIPPDRIDEEPVILERLRRGERIEQYETVRMRKDGTRIDVSLTVSPIRDAEGRIIGASKIARDVTERKRAEALLREETRTLELLNRTGGLIASQLDLQSLLQSVTDAATNLSGAQFGAFFYNTTDERGEAFLLYTLSGAPREAFEGFGHPRATPLFGPTFRGERPVRLDDVRQDPRYGQWAPHHGMPEGHLPVRSYLAVPVISRSNEVIGGLFFGHEEPAVFTERTERIIVGVAAQAAVAIDNARLYEGATRAAEERKKLLEAERAARAEAERAGLMKDEFLAMLSHELRTPLSAILGWSQILQMEGYTPEDLKEGLETIARNGRAQTRLIDDLLDMNRIVSGKVRLDVQPIDLSALVDAAVDSVRHSAEAKSIRLRKIIDPHAGPVSGDPARLQQVVWNLLTNAMKFTPKGGRVDVVVERVNSHVEITVSDSGEGISPDFLPYVFERFRQADSSLTRKHGGLGLGLSIVKQLVELHGGAVSVKSPGEGQGATFTVSLPLAPVRESSNREHPLTPRRSLLGFNGVDLSGIKILVIDDEPDARELTKRVLTQCRAIVSTAGGAAEGLEQVKRSKPDVIVSDIGMPERDGYQFIRDVRALTASEGGATPAVALTAFARSEDRTRAMMAGYQVHVAKPIEPEELVATVASLAGRMTRRQV